MHTIEELQILQRASQVGKNAYLREKRHKLKKLKAIRDVLEAEHSLLSDDPEGAQYKNVCEIERIADLIRLCEAEIKVVKFRRPTRFERLDVI